MYLNIKNQYGSVQHYYHFLLGFLFPLVEWYAFNQDSLPKNIKVRSCAILDPIIKELALPSLEIISKEELISITEDQIGLIKNCELVDEVRGYDTFHHFDGPKLRRIARVIKKYLSKEISIHEERILNEKEKSDAEILIINRKNSDPFYLSDQSEVIDSGNARRSIPNFNELVNGLQANVLKVKSVCLECTSLAYQIALFSNASCIIAQHGAALANLVFTKKRTRLIEIKPSDLRTNVKDCFANLSAELGVGYQFVHQDGSQGIVSLDALLKTYHEGVAWNKDFQILHTNESTQVFETNCSSFYAGKIQGLIDGVPMKTDKKVLVRIWNLSASDWYSEGEAPVRVTYHWYRKNGTIVVMNGQRSKFPNGILKSGEIIDIPVLITPPEEAGEYLLELTLVRENILWFEQSNEFESHKFTINVLLK